ncbi:MAG: acyl-CoA dehydrogenase family protein [Rubrivivax sp.]
MNDLHPIPDARGGNLYLDDAEGRALLPLYLPAALLLHLQPHLERLGALAGGVLDERAATADRNPPVLEHRSRTGLDRQRIVKHPAYAELERVAFGDFGLAALSHRGGVLGWPEPMPPAAKYALSYVFVQAEFGLCCPLSMTDSLTRTLRRFGAPELVQQHLGRLTSQDLDELAQGAMFITEQGAGSDVGASTTRAEPQSDGRYRLWGDKWFCSNPDAALAMVLARIDGAPSGTRGLSLFLLPRQRADGSDNAYRILRLKDKLGSRSMASGEIRLDGAEAWLVGDAGAGFRQMADMINNSRLSNGMRAAGMMRRAFAEAEHVARQRQAFGRPLVQLPLMRRQLLKLLLPAEQARTMVFQAADALRRADAGDAQAYALTRVLTPLIKFRACRDARRVTGDAMEVRGGCGYIEEWSDARLVRDAHLGSIWEGTSNIVALDVIRAARREGSLQALQQHLEGLLAATALHPAVQPVFAGSLQRALQLAAQVAEGQGRHDQAARQAASALYHVSTACAMAWEASRTGSARRMALAQLVLRHRVLPQDPLRLHDDGVAAALLDDGAATPTAVADVQLV